MPGPIYDDRSFPPPSNVQEPDREWAQAVLAEWERRGYTDLDGAALDQLKLARCLLGLNRPWPGDEPH